MRLLAARSPFLHAARVARLTLAAAATLVVGCGDGDPTTPDARVVGSYALVTYEGRAVPIAEEGGGARVELLGGRLELRDDERFDIALDTRETNIATGEVREDTEALSGDYAVRRDVITFINTGDREFDGAQATVSGTTVTLGPLVFRQ